MSGAAETIPTPEGMLVRALYDYDAEDQISISFQRGDLIQVITRLKSGWWDGMVNGARGWFPSNYCAVIREGGGAMGSTAVGEEEDVDASDGDYDLTSGYNGDLHRGSIDDEQEEAAFWIPQAMPDGRLYYFNTLTGRSVWELPLESPTSMTETGPRDRYNVNLPGHTRPPPESMAGGIEQEDDTDYDSESEADGQRNSTSKKSRQSYISDGVSPATSIGSFGVTPPSTGSHPDLRNINSDLCSMQLGYLPVVAGSTAFGYVPGHSRYPASLPARFFDDHDAVPLTWNRMLEDMRRAIERFRQAMKSKDKGQYVRRAEEISDHLRLLLAAGSGSTDNHSGDANLPSTISANKALYPHFRDMMSSFSRLILSAQLAAADFVPRDASEKCLQEADGVLAGVISYVEVARQQRGEEIPRLVPGFVLGNHCGGAWQSNGLGSDDPIPALPFLGASDYEPFVTPMARLDKRLIERLEELKRTINHNIRRLQEELVLNEKLITAAKHRSLSESICSAGGKVVESYKSWMSNVESVTLSPLDSKLENHQLVEFAFQKQRLYDTVSELVVACQDVASPLGDEWTEMREPSLEERVETVRLVTQELEACTSRLYYSLQLLSEAMLASTVSSSPGASRGAEVPSTSASLSSSSQVPILARLAVSPGETTIADPTLRNGENAKIKKFFGEVPVTASAPRGMDEIPSYLRLDHEGEIIYDHKVSPAQLRGGTLVALVEQLTRHDRLETDFNKTFLLTYRSFCSSEELFEHLVRRWSIQPPPGISQEDYQVWVEKKQKIVRLRIVNVMKGWFDTYWMEGDDQASQSLLQRAHDFAKDTVASTGTPGSGPLMSAIEQRLQGRDPSIKRLVQTTNQPPPPPILPKNLKKFRFLDVDPLEFARQLTIMESKLYAKITPADCLEKAWARKLKGDQHDPASNIKALIVHSNYLTNWAAYLVLAQNDVKKRVAVIKHLVAIAEKGRSINNFSSMTAIMAALSTSPVARLQRTWNNVPARTMTISRRYRDLMSGDKNFREYREALHSANPPCLPFFGVYLTDITFIEDGIPATIKNTELINFSKRAKTAEVIREMQQYQNSQYNFQAVPELQNFLHENLRRSSEVNELYERSLQIEPREREDEKIARLLSESGFL